MSELTPTRQIFQMGLFESIPNSDQSYWCEAVRKRSIHALCVKVRRSETLRFCQAPV
jgi:hypothetical protein